MVIQKIIVIRKKSKRQHTDYRAMVDWGHDEFNKQHFGLHTRVGKNRHDFMDDLGEI